MMKLTNCINCGAPLHSNKCDYCGTEYDLDQNIRYVRQVNDECITLNVYGHNVDFYIGDIEVHSICGNPYRTDDGILHLTKIKPLMRLNLISASGIGEEDESGEYECKW